MAQSDSTPFPGFVTSNWEMPEEHNVNDWLVWHMTHVSNFEPILEAGSLSNFTNAKPRVSIALTGVQVRRSQVIISSPAGYPPGKSLHDHVPFYFSARSPMQYAIAKGHDGYSEGNGSLIFIAARIGAIQELGYTWCFSDRNATIAGAKFYSHMQEIPHVLSTNILSRKYWQTPGGISHIRSHESHRLRGDSYPELQDP